MTRTLPGTPGAVHTFAGNPLDRAESLRRDENWLAAAAARHDARFLPFDRLRVGLKPNAASLAWLPSADLPAGARASAVLLGLQDDVPHFAIDLSAEDGNRSDVKYTDCRQAAMALDTRDAGIVAHGRTQLDWHRRHRFCGQCGTETTAARGGQVRACATCENQQFPRTDPVVIMLITDPSGDRCLLGQSNAAAMRRMNLYSALAGFVDHAESIEEAVRREVHEEAGIAVGDVHYHSSQPWPFPASLMIGCHGVARSTDIVIDPEEMAAVAWFSREEVREAFAGDASFQLPGPIAIAHHLIHHWLGQETPS